MPKVFVLEQPRKHLDLSPAKEFGEIVYLFEPSDRRPSVFRSQEYVAAIVDALHKKFNPSTDHFAVVGSMNNVALAMAALTLAFDLGHEVRILLFNASTGAYESTELKIHNYA